MVSEYINVLLLKKYICCSSLYKPNYFCVDLFSNHVRFWNTIECVLHWHCLVEYLLHPHECRVSYNCPRDKLRVNIWWDRIINMYMYFHFQCFKSLPLKLSPTEERTTTRLNLLPLNKKTMAMLILYFACDWDIGG